MTKKIPKISKAEWEVMKVLWAGSPLMSADIVETLSPGTGWKPNTIKTLLARLVKKGAVAADKSGREFLYRPLVDEAQCVRAESRSFASRVYSGAMMPMIAQFLQEEKLSREEIDELRRLLDEMDKKAKGK